MSTVTRDEIEVETQKDSGTLDEKKDTLKNDKNEEDEVETKDSDIWTIKDKVVVFSVIMMAIMTFAVLCFLTTHCSRTRTCEKAIHNRERNRLQWEIHRLGAKIERIQDNIITGKGFFMDIDMMIFISIVKI
jgi:hypothetical protein